MRRAIIAAAIVLVAVTGAVAPAAAQETPTPTPTENASQASGEQVDQNTELLSSSYNSGSGMIELTIRSDTLQQVTVTDAGAFMTGGEVERRTVTLRPDDTTTIKIPATKYRGYVGASISTRETLYAVPIEISNPWFQGDSTWSDVQAAGGGSAVGVLLVTGVLAWRRRDGGREEVRRRA